MEQPSRLGIDLGGSKIEAALLAADGRVLWRQREPTPGGDYRATLACVAALVDVARGVGPDPAPSIGVGHPGSLTPAGLVRNANSTCLNGRPLQADLEALLGQPLRLANDANCLALSEATDGAGAGASVVFAVILGTGVGAGVAVHGQVLAGANGLAGEWGHNPLPWADPQADPAPPCYCGQAGCIETLLSGPGLVADHRRHGGGPIDAATIAARSLDGDAACEATLVRHAGRLARALAGVINLLDPDVVVLAGGVSRLPRLRQRVLAQWERWVFSAGGQAPLQTALRLAEHGDASGVRGAAWLWGRGSTSA